MEAKAAGDAHKLEHDLIGDVWPFFGDFLQNVPPELNHDAAIKTGEINEMSDAYRSRPSSTLCHCCSIAACGMAF